MVSLKIVEQSGLFQGQILEVLRIFLDFFVSLNFFFISKNIFHVTLDLSQVTAFSSTNIAWGFDLCNIVPRVLRQHCTEFVLMQCCQEPLGQHGIEFWAVQCCPKSIKTKLHRILSYTMLSGASRTILHRVLTCSMLPQKYYDKIEQDFSLLNVVWSL